MDCIKSEERLVEEARKRVEAKKGLFIHVLVYLLVNALVVTAWHFSGVSFPWFVFPLGGWGIGLVFHFLAVFVFSRRLQWEEAMIQRELSRLRR